MYNSRALIAYMRQAGFTQASAAAAMGMSLEAFSNKLNFGSWGVDDANKLIFLFGISDPSAVFFGGPMISRQ